MQPSEYSVPVPSDRQAILCLHCGKPQEVGRKAMSVTCKFCSKALKIEDVKISRYEARRVIEACGTVTIDKKGHVVSDIRCVNLQLKGKLKGDVVGLHEVVLESGHDRIYLCHDAKSRRGFAEGAVRTAEWLAGKKGFHHFKDIWREL